MTVIVEPEETATAFVVNHDIPCRAVTDDYKIVADSRIGYKVVANRRIKKGELVMTDSLEFTFSDVREGDHIWFGTTHLRKKGASSKFMKDPTEVPERIPVTREMLLRSHGVHYVIKESSEEVVVRYYLESPTMFMNHSCEPTMVCDDRDEDIATRDIEVGEELTVDYALCDYVSPREIKECLCGTPSCRKTVFDFRSLSAEDKKKIFPMLSPAVKAIYLADIGQGPPVREVDDMIPRPLAAGGGGVVGEARVMRLMWPGPSWAEANVMIKKDEKSNEYGLYATKNVTKGKRVYEFWRQPWPQGENTLIDMVFSAPDREVQEGDVEEGTVIRLDVSKCGSSRNAKGKMMFSGWEMLNSHSSDPNVVYRNNEKNEDEPWQAVFAAKNIKKGDRITMDWNCFIWDRSGTGETLLEGDASNCCADTTNLGFKHLSLEAQHELTHMTWLRKALPTNSATETLGKALSPYVRAMWKKVDIPLDDSDGITEVSTSCSDSSTSGDNKED